jgi:hypothetical protein
MIGVVSVMVRQQVSFSASAGILNSWKEIAIYLGRGVRTVQRWEQDLGLPVHRPRGKQRSAVLAVPAELDLWIRNTPGRGLDDVLEIHVQNTPLSPGVLPTITRAAALRAQTRELRVRSAALIRRLVESTHRQREDTVRLQNRIQNLNGETEPTRKVYAPLALGQRASAQ